MIVEISAETLYTVITVLLIALQIWQYYKLTKLEKTLQSDIDSIWKQLAILVTSTASKLIDLEKRTNEKNDSQPKK